MDNNFKELKLNPVEFKQNNNGQEPGHALFEHNPADYAHMNNAYSNHSRSVDDMDKFNPSWVKNKLDELVIKNETKQKSVFDINHNMENHSKRFFGVIDNERRKTGNSREIYKLYNAPDEITLGKEYKAQFRNRISDEARERKKLNKKSRLFWKNENANLIEKTTKDFLTDSYDALNRAMTKQAFLCENMDYGDLAMFMKKGKDKYNIKLVNLYLGKSVKSGPGGLEGQDVQLALDYMAGQLFAVDIREITFENDTEMTKKAALLEKISGQVAAFDRMAKKHNFMDSLNDEEKKRLNERLNSLRSISAYYSIRKEIISNDYYKNHYNDELSTDIAGASNDEQRILAEKLVKSFVLGRTMMKLNGIDVKKLGYKGENLVSANPDTIRIANTIIEDYSKKETRKKLSDEAHAKKDAIAKKELERLKEALGKLNRETPLEEQKNIQNDMTAVFDRAFVPVKRPENKIGFWTKFKNRVMVGYRFLLGTTIGTVASIFSNIYFGAETMLLENGRKKEAQDKRRHDIVPGREGEFFREEIVRKNDEGEDLDVYSDVRRGPLVWEKLTAGDPEEPPEVCIMIEQAKRGSAAALSGGMGHAIIGLTYSRYNKATKRKERYQLRIGYYPGGGIGYSTPLAMTHGAVVGGSVSDDNLHNYDISRRYQVKPGDINKILRESEKYADKGYNYFTRNCTNFVVDMAKSINLPIAKELKEEEMRFDGVKGFLLESGTAFQKGGYYFGANGISSRMNKMDLSYTNFGQKMYTKEDLDRYYKTYGTGDTIKKGYSPGAVGEQLREAQSGEIGAYFNEHSKIKLKDLADTIAVTGTSLLNDVLGLIPENQRTEVDNAAMMYIAGTFDGGLGALSQQEKITPEDVRKVHKTVRTAMKNLSKYYTERLGSDERISGKVMELLSLYELTLYFADRLYRSVVHLDTKGDMGYTRHSYRYVKRTVSFVDANKKTTDTEMTPGEYEGYLMSGKTPEQAIKEKARYNEISGIPEANRTKEQTAERNKLEMNLDLARSFASANRYILEKENVDDKDIRYAFIDLPKMEKKVNKEGERVKGSLIMDYAPSFTYQGVIFEKLFAGMKKLHIKKIDGVRNQTKVLDEYIVKHLMEKPQLARQILKCLNDNVQGEAGFISNRFLGDLAVSYITPVCLGDKMDPVVASSIGIFLMQDSKTKKWLTDEVNSIRNGGGIQ